MLHIRREQKDGDNCGALTGPPITEQYGHARGEQKHGSQPQKSKSVKHTAKWHFG